MSRLVSLFPLDDATVTAAAAHGDVSVRSALAVNPWLDRDFANRLLAADAAVRHTVANDPGLSDQRWGALMQQLRSALAASSPSSDWSRPSTDGVEWLAVSELSQLATGELARMLTLTVAGGGTFAGPLAGELATRDRTLAQRLSRGSLPALLAAHAVTLCGPAEPSRTDAARHLDEVLSAAAAAPQDRVDNATPGQFAGVVDMLVRAATGPADAWNEGGHAGRTGREGSGVDVASLLVSVFATVREIRQDRLRLAGLLAVVAALRSRGLTVASDEGAGPSAYSVAEQTLLHVAAGRPAAPSSLVWTRLFSLASVPAGELAATVGDLPVLFAHAAELERCGALEMLLARLDAGGSARSGALRVVTAATTRFEPASWPATAQSLAALVRHGAPEVLGPVPWPALLTICASAGSRVVAAACAEAVCERLCSAEELAVFAALSGQWQGTFASLVSTAAATAAG